MKTSHPGGWEDIAAFMDREKILVPDARGRTITATETMDKYPHGAAAAMLWKSLLAHGWFVPGDPEWETPCSEWKRR